MLQPVEWLTSTGLKICVTVHFFCRFSAKWERSEVESRQSFRGKSGKHIYLPTLVPPGFDSSPEGIHLLVYQLLNLWVLHRRLRSSRRIRACDSLNTICTRVTSRTTEMWGFTVPRSRWKRMVCKRARSTSLVVWRSPDVRITCSMYSNKRPPYDVNDNHWWVCTVHSQTSGCMRGVWALMINEAN